MRATTWTLGALLLALTAAGCKRGPDELPPGDSGVMSSRPSDGGLTGTVTSADPNLNSTKAEAIAMAYAASHWPQHHARMASGHKMGTYWKVVIEFEDPVGGHVIIDMAGNIIDGGTSLGEH